MPFPFSSRRGNSDDFVEKCQVKGTGRLDEVTSSVLPWILKNNEYNSQIPDQNSHIQFKESDQQEDTL